jgi:hypothetical protein
MSTATRSLLIPLVLAVIGLVALGFRAAASMTEPTGVSPMVAATPQTTTTTLAPVVTTQPPAIHGISDEVARVLAAEGFAAREVVDGLPESVVAVLQQHNVVLTVAVPEN